MLKEFDKWNEAKQTINYQKERVFYHEREIWWCALGINIGTEQDGTGKNYDRPILVLKGFNKDSLLGIALTGKEKKGKYYYFLGILEDRPATLVLSQVRLLDSKRLIRKMITLDEHTFNKIKAALVAALFN